MGAVDNPQINVNFFLRREMMLNLSVGVYSLHSGLILEILLPDSTAGATGDLSNPF